MTSLSDISKITTRLLLNEPFYGHFLLGMPKEFSTSIETACVSLLNSKIIKLSVNAEFWNSLAEKKQYGLIKHEILHVALRHLFILKDYRNRSIFNIAADLVVNQYIKESQLPEGALHLSTFDYLKTTHGIILEPLQSTAYYYHKLMKVLQNKPIMSLDAYEAQHGKISRLDDLMDQENSQQEKHKRWNDFDKLSEAEKKVMEYQLHNHVKNVMNKINARNQMAGSLPGHLLELLHGFLEEYKAQVDWKRVLKKFASSSTSSYIKNTIRRPSKRYGTTPGIKVKRRHKILVALDTSGSVPIQDIQLFFSELHHIWKQGAEVIIIECDAAINKTYTYNGKPPKAVSGRGGTNFNPPIIEANKSLRPDCIIYFTDGYELPPSVKSRCPVLWIFTPRGINESNKTWHTFKGLKVKMK